MAGNDHRGSHPSQPSNRQHAIEGYGVWQPEIGSLGGDSPIGYREPGAPTSQDVGTSGWFNPSGYGSGFGAGGSETRSYPPAHDEGPYGRPSYAHGAYPGDAARGRRGMHAESGGEYGAHGGGGYDPGRYPRDDDYERTQHWRSESGGRRYPDEGARDVRYGGYAAGGGIGRDVGFGRRPEHGHGFDRPGRDADREFGRDPGRGAWAPPPRDPNRPRGPKNYRRSDERLRELIAERLIDDPHIDSSDVSITVTSGEVMLEGTVEDRREKYAIEELVDGIHGVRDVNNRLRTRRGFLSNLLHGERDESRHADRDGWTTAGHASQEGPATTQQEGSQGGRHQYGRPT